MQNYKQYQKDYEKACKLLGRNTELPDTAGMSEVKAMRTTSEHILEAITDAENMKANNGKEWVPNMANTSEGKYHPYFHVIPDEGAPRGFRLACYGYDYVYDFASLGARLAAKTSSIAIALGKKYPDLYKDVSF